MNEYLEYQFNFQDLFIKSVSILLSAKFSSYKSNKLYIKYSFWRCVCVCGYVNKKKMNDCVFYVVEIKAFCILVNRAGVNPSDRCSSPKYPTLRSLATYRV